MSVHILISNIGKSEKRFHCVQAARYVLSEEVWDISTDIQTHKRKRVSEISITVNKTHHNKQNGTSIKPHTWNPLRDNGLPWDLLKRPVLGDCEDPMYDDDILRDRSGGAFLYFGGLFVPGE